LLQPGSCHRDDRPSEVASPARATVARKRAKPGARHLAKKATPKRPK